MRLVNSIVLWSLVLISTLFYGQNFSSRNFTTSDGLANNAVRSLFFDNKNVLWIGTENGISVFQNDFFKNLTKDDGLSQNSCWGICQDTKNNMWFASYGGGVTKFDGKSFTIFDTKSGLANNKTRKVFSFRDKIIVGTEYGISIIDINSNAVFTPKEVFPHFGVFIVTDIFEYNNDIYFTALNEGIFKIINLASTPKVIPHIELKNSYSATVFKSKLYNSNKGFFDVFNLHKPINAIPENFGESIGWEFASDKDDQLYVACWGIFDNNGGLFQIKNNRMLALNSKFGIDSKKLLSVVYDQENDVLYVGSKSNGFFQVQLNKAILYEKFEDQKILGFERNVILHENGLDFIGENDKFRKIDRSEFKIFQTKYLSKNKVKQHDLPEENFELNLNVKAEAIEFYGLVKHQERFYVNSNIGVFTIDQKATIIDYVPIHTYNFGFTAAGFFYETHPYGSTKIYDGIDKLNLKGSSTEVSNIVQSINIDKTTYFLSVFGGLSSFANGTFKSYLISGLFKEEKLKYATKNSKNHLIVSSEFGEVFIIRDLINFKKTTKIKREQIIGNSINFLESYGNYILIGTEKGITVYNEGKIQLIDKEQGLLDNTVTSSAIIQDILYLGTDNGYYKINLASVLSKKNEVSKIEIKELLINNKPIAATNFNWFSYKSKKLETAYNKNTISIDFIAVGNAFPDKLKYRYRLGRENQWSPYSEKTNLFLPYLPFNNYNLEIEVSDLNSGTTTIFPLLEIVVLPPFYYSWWFLLAAFFFILGVSYYIFFRLKKRAKERDNIQKRITETKLEALLSQMNPHFTFNAMNAIQNYVIVNDTLNSLYYIGEFAKLMRKTLDNSSKLTLPLAEEIDYLKNYISIENMRFNHKVDVVFVVKNSVNLDAHIPTMLLQPFVENVFVHAFSNLSLDPKLVVSFEMKNETTLGIQIIDNGKGIQKDGLKLYESKGILLAKERLALLQNNIKPSIEFQNNNPSGTIVLIEIQL